jgi:4-amino-4-deoxy-L-arabinose transferase-like glycosyltransferase
MRGQKGKTNGPEIAKRKAMTLLDRISAGWKAWVILFLLTFVAAAPGVFTLPALDRDESRFAQASKEMLEEGDYIRIQYQDELRNKKPAGIHWLQAATTAATTGPEAKQIWTYRTPNWIGVALATLATFWSGIALVGRRAAFLGSALFGTTLLLTSEAHIAKTDGVLIFLTTLSIGALARLYVYHRDDQPNFNFKDAVKGAHQTPGAKRLALLFWLCMGLGFLIKGPVTPMVAAYAGFGAWVWAKAAHGEGGDWWRPLIWWPGPLIFVALVLPWFLWIQAATNGDFFRGAVGKDLADKFTGASEGHGGWPFYHLTHLPAWFFPATLMIVPAVMASWNTLKARTAKTYILQREAFVLGAGSLGAMFVFAFLVGLLPQGLQFKPLPAWPALVLFGFWALAYRANWQRHQTRPEGTSDEARNIRFLVAWTVLTFFFFELMPTQLSHYILPAYPAMGLLCGYAANRLIGGEKMPIARWGSLTTYALGAGVLLVLSFPGITTYLMEEAAGDFRTVDPSTVLESWTAYREFPLWMWWGGFLLAGVSLIEFARSRDGLAILFGVVASIVIGWHVRIFMLPSQTWIQATETGRLALEEVCGVPDGDPDCSVKAPARVLAIGYAEPSYVFTLGTQNLHPPETPLELPGTEDSYPVVYLINLEDRKAEPAVSETVASLKTQAVRLNLCINESRPFYAVNYSNGDPVHFRALRFDTEPCN